jgi:hypothetical protein
LAYEIWRDMHMPMLEWLLGDLERTAALWEDCERRCRAAQAARDDGSTPSAEHGEHRDRNPARPGRAPARALAPGRGAEHVGAAEIAARSAGSATSTGLAHRQRGLEELADLGAACGTSPLWTPLASSRPLDQAAAGARVTPAA